MITLTGQHYSEEAIIQSVHNALDLEQAKHIMQIMNPRLCKEGNQWCYIWGDVPELFIVGFGDTPIEAMFSFVHDFRSHKLNIDKNDETSVASITGL